MGSIIPFQDLNLLPPTNPNPNTPIPLSTSTPTPSSATTGTRLLIPKIEKIEPWEEPLQTQEPLQAQEPQEHMFFQTPNYLSTPRNTHFPEHNSQSPPQTPGEEDVYSQFCKVTELFRAAFAKESQGYKAAHSNASDSDSLAIVPVPQANPVSSQVSPYENQASSAVVPKKKYKQRSSELVRVTNLGIEDQRYYRRVVRRTRMVFDSLRIFSLVEEGRKLGLSLGKRPRGDLMAAAAMRARDFWMNRDKRIVGTVPGIYVGDMFLSRMELLVFGLHGQVQAGIDYLPGSQSSNGEPIATSVIVSGGYEDDEDSGDVIFYTGHGGQDKYSKQVADQKLEGGNLALERSMRYGIELRVIRGVKYASASKVYIYDGLYNIVDCWFDVGKSGFGVYKFKLLRIEGQPEMGSATFRLAQGLKKEPLIVKPKGYCSLDMSKGKENLPVLLFNDIDCDQSPLYYEYLSRAVFPPFVSHQSGNVAGCECVSGCIDDCLCAMKNGGSLAYDTNGFLVRGKPLIFECGPSCHCPPTCRNRVTQKGVKKRLEVFRSVETGWGLRSLDLIVAGSFISEYAGVVLTREQAQIFAMSGDALIYPQRFSERWAEWGDVSDIYPEYVRPNYPPVSPLDFAMDVSKMRNSACYISHSSTPNVFVQLVLYDHNNLMFPHLMLFAMETIPPMRELSLDYGVADEVTGKLAICI